jgi:hypothetical protein
VGKIAGFLYRNGPCHGRNTPENKYFTYLPVTVDEVPHVLLQFLVGHSDAENFSLPIATFQIIKYRCYDAQIFLDGGGGGFEWIILVLWSGVAHFLSGAFS